MGLRDSYAQLLFTCTYAASLSFTMTNTIYTMDVCELLIC